MSGSLLSQPGNGLGSQPAQHAVGSLFARGYPFTPVTEGSYLEPATNSGMKYLEAIRDVFNTKKRSNSYE